MLFKNSIFIIDPISNIILKNRPFPLFPITFPSFLAIAVRTSLTSIFEYLKKESEKQIIENQKLSELKELLLSKLV